jgi:uncharacterized protein (UPF0332 family)
LDRAHETLEEARIMANAEHWNGCVNRLYYACFYAVNALLMQKDLSSPKHSGVRSLLNVHFIKTGVLTKEMGRLYNTLFEYRQQSDYEDLFRIDGDMVNPWVTQVKQFIETIEALIKQ